MSTRNLAQSTISRSQPIKQKWVREKRQENTEHSRLWSCTPRPEQWSTDLRAQVHREYTETMLTHSISVCSQLESFRNIQSNLKLGEGVPIQECKWKTPTVRHPICTTFNTVYFMSSSTWLVYYWVSGLPSASSQSNKDTIPHSKQSWSWSLKHRHDTTLPAVMIMISQTQTHLFFCFHWSIFPTVIFSWFQWVQLLW